MAVEKITDTVEAVVNSVIILEAVVMTAVTEDWPPDISNLPVVAVV